MNKSKAGAPSFDARRNLPNHQLSWSVWSSLMRNFHDVFIEMFAKSQPRKMSCHIPCDFVKCHEVSCISRVLISMLPIKVSHGEGGRYLQ